MCPVAVVLVKKVLIFVIAGLSCYLKMADTTKAGLKKPIFTKVDQLRPGTSGHNVTVKIVSTKMVLQKGRADGPQARQLRISECIVGDETGVIVFTARNDQGIITICVADSSSVTG